MMLLLAALAAATAQSPYTPELEALMRHRDEKRAVETRTRVAQEQQGGTLASVIPPAIAERLSACLSSADLRPESGLADAVKWAGEGGAYAAHCKGYSLGKAGKFADAAGAFESGAVLPNADVPTQARLWSQAGNAALAGGDAARALADLNHALEKPLPAALSTGEMHLDRARARVATGDLKARAPISTVRSSWRRRIRSAGCSRRHSRAAWTICRWRVPISRKRRHLPATMAISHWSRASSTRSRRSRRGREGRLPACAGSRAQGQCRRGEGEYLSDAACAGGTCVTRQTVNPFPGEDRGAVTSRIGVTDRSCSLPLLGSGLCRKRDMLWTLASFAGAREGSIWASNEFRPQERSQCPNISTR